MADIEDLHTLFTDLLPAHQTARFSILPFHSLISHEEQEKVFEPTPTLAKVILATNIAEASLTIKDVKFVVDFGVSKVRFPPSTRSSMYSSIHPVSARLLIYSSSPHLHHTNKQTLRYEVREHRTVLGYSWVSQASANQRRGRTGRVCDGHVIRLYTRAFFQSLPPHEVRYPTHPPTHLPTYAYE